ncbi:MAG: hypothetical protein STHCBS139747_005964 [Sporothrix thermara]
MLSKVVFGGGRRSSRDSTTALNYLRLCPTSKQETASQVGYSNNGGVGGIVDDSDSDSEDELAYSYMSDEELTMGSETANLMGARKHLWDASIDSGLLSRAPATSTVENMQSLRTAAASVVSAAASASAQALRAAEVAQKLARRATATTTASAVAAGKVEILNRFINGTAQAPGQVLSWMTSGRSQAEDKAKTKAKVVVSGETDSRRDDPKESVYEFVLQPGGRSLATGSLCTTPMVTGLSPFTTSAYSTSTLPTSCSGVGSVPDGAPALDENIDTADCDDIMSAGTLFERNSAGRVVPVAVGGGFDEAENCDYEVVFDDRDGAEHSLEENEGDYCILASVPNKTK